MLPILPESAWREFRGAAKNKGLNQTTHQALIMDAQGVEHLCYVKTSPPEYPMVVAEAIAWMVADALQLARPEFAAVIQLPVPRLMQCMPLDQHWLRYSAILGYCSSAVQGTHIVGRLALTESASAFRHRSVAEIAAFDVWMENPDRNLGNFLRTAQGDYIPIDNEYVLYSLLWRATGLAVQQQSLRAAAQVELKHHDYEKFEAAMILASGQHLDALRDVSSRLYRFILAMTPDRRFGTNFATAVLSFLETRAQAGWLASELGQFA